MTGGGEERRARGVAGDDRVDRVRGAVDEDIALRNGRRAAGSRSPRRECVDHAGDGSAGVVGALNMCSARRVLDQQIGERATGIDRKSETAVLKGRRGLRHMLICQVRRSSVKSTTVGAAASRPPTGGPRTVVGLVRR